MESPQNPPKRRGRPPKYRPEVVHREPEIAVQEPVVETRKAPEPLPIIQRERVKCPKCNSIRSWFVNSEVVDDKSRIIKRHCKCCHTIFRVLET